MREEKEHPAQPSREQIRGGNQGADIVEMTCANAGAIRGDFSSSTSSEFRDIRGPKPAQPTTPSPKPEK